MIPEEIKKHIDELYVPVKSSDYISPKDFEIACEARKELRFAAEFGYGLALQQIADKEKEGLYWQQRCEAAEAYLIAMKNWFEKELSLQGFDEFSKSYDYWKQLKDQKPKEE